MTRAGDKNPNFKHGLTDGESFRHPVYSAWSNMKQRCLNPNHPKYHRYGGRGISICDQWMNSKNFSKWAFENDWQKGLTLDRKNNDGNYEPSNCHWVLLSLNSRKKHTTKLSLVKAKEIRQHHSSGYTIKHLAELYDVTEGTVYFIVNEMTWKS